MSAYIFTKKWEKRVEDKLLEKLIYLLSILVSDNILVFYKKNQFVCHFPVLSLFPCFSFFQIKHVLKFIFCELSVLFYVGVIRIFWSHNR